MKKHIFLFVILSSLFLSSCKAPVELTGEWENEERILKFDDEHFEIEFKNPNQIKSFLGKTSRKNNTITLFFENYITSDGVIGYTDETNLAGHKEILEIKRIDNILYTEIIATGKEYKYLKRE